MKKIGIIIIVLMFLGYVGVVLKKNNQPVQSSVNHAKTTSNDNVIMPPVPLSSANVFSLGLNYVFSGKVKEFKPEGPTNYHLVLDTTNKAIPPFTLTEKTTFVKIVDKNPVPIDVENIKVGKEIRISAIYGLKTKNWMVGRVFLIENQSSKSSL